MKCNCGKQFEPKFQSGTTPGGKQVKIKQRMCDDCSTILKKTNQVLNKTL